MPVISGTGIRPVALRMIAVQLAHAGRTGSTDVLWKGGKQIVVGAKYGRQTVAPSSLPESSADRALG
jgi:2,4-dienoyl-CoA reductase-like NADH-dependent reductase (Old Yellow Enzyme family)